MNLLDEPGLWGAMAVLSLLWVMWRAQHPERYLMPNQVGVAGALAVGAGCTGMMLWNMSEEAP